MICFRAVRVATARRCTSAVRHRHASMSAPHASTPAAHASMQLALTHVSMFQPHRHHLVCRRRGTRFAAHARALSAIAIASTSRGAHRGARDVCQRRRSTRSTHRYACVDRVDRVRIDALSAKNSRALSHLRIVLSGTHRAARTSMRTTMSNACHARARVHDARACNIARCCKPA